jgi:hypothetical protein
VTISSKMSHKVMPSAKVSRPATEMQNNALNSDLRQNPSQANGNSPPTMPSERAEQQASNPPPYFPTKEG